MNRTYRIGLLIVLVALLVPGAVFAQQLRISTSLSDSRIRAIHQDRPGALWIDTIPGG